MWKKAICRRIALLSTSFVVSLATAVVVAQVEPGAETEEPTSTPSSYAPAEDLLRLVDLYFEDLADDLSDEEDYDEDYANRVAMTANTLVAVAMTLDNHGEENPLKGRSADFIQLAQDLVTASDDYAQAAEALEKLREQFDQAGPGDSVAWDSVADITLLMQHVPIVNNSLRRGVGGRRFERNTEKNLALAAALAAIAQASTYDLNYVFDDDEADEWQQICADMRDASAAVAEAVRQGDQETAKAGLDRIVETCDACHHQFRD